jgi:BMFP domain-containing protein YqiC
MPKTSHLFEDMTKMAAGLAGSALDFKREIESAVTARCEAWAQGHGFVSRDEFEAVRSMAQTARTEVEALKAEIAKLKK